MPSSSVGVGFSNTEFGERTVRDCSGFQCSVQRHYITFDSPPFGLLGSSGVGREGRADFLSVFFEYFEPFRENRFRFFGGSYAVGFDAIFMPCTLVSHTTRAFRGDAYCCLLRRFGIGTPR